jgi:hypothetical protein
MLFRAFVLGASIVAAGVFALSALATTYAGPKTWNQGWDASSGYDSSPHWFYDNEMTNKSAPYDSRVAFIDPGGNWSYSYTDASWDTWTLIPSPSEAYQKKAYCKNNSAAVYVATCIYKAD